MNEENYTCGICFENYDLKNENKLPKKVTCCNKTFCLSCLNDIYIRNNQQLKCPNCRKITTLPPIYLKNNQLVSSRFLICCNCHEKVPQNQLYFNKINNEILIKCQKCENGDMKLDDILPDFVSEINNNLKEYETGMKNDVIDIIKNKIKNEITEYFNNIIKNLIEIMNQKIINSFNKKWDLQNRQNEFKNMILQFSQSYKYLNSFIEDEPTKSYESKKILNCMKYYNDNISKIKKEFDFFENTKKWVSNNRLIYINQNFNFNYLEDGFISIFNKNNNNYENKNYIHNENIYNKNNNKLLSQDEKIIYNDKLLMELDKLIIKTNVDK